MLEQGSPDRLKERGRRFLFITTSRSLIFNGHSHAVVMSFSYYLLSAKRLENFILKSLNLNVISAN